MAGAAGLLIWLGDGTAGAHEPGEDAVPDSPGWRLGAAAALVLPQATERWPSAGWPGVLIDGSAPRDRRHGLRLEHATLDLAARVEPRLGAHAAIGLHDRDSPHLEAARLQGRMAWGEGELVAGLGRDTVRLGPAIDGAGHFDRFSLAPLAARAVLNEQWIDDGASLAWRQPEADGLRTLEAGLWRGRVFPGGPAGPVVPSLRLHAGWGHVDAHLGAARFEPEARGAAVQSAGTVGHLHGTPDCREGLQQKVCFEGRVDLLAASLQWTPDDSAWTLSLAGLARRERGSLYSPSGDAAIRSTVSGWWADLAWQATPRWTLATRAERLVPRHRLEGIGTTLLAREAGLIDGGPVARLGIALLHEWQPGLQLAVEGGQERHRGGRVSHLALRLVWRQPRWLGGEL